jgi:hypothetical protein
MCTMMDLIQRRHMITHQTPRDWRFYLEKHAGMSRDEYFAAPPAQPGDYELLVHQRTRLRWLSPDQHAVAGQQSRSRGLLPRAGRHEGAHGADVARADVGERCGVSAVGGAFQ